ncbi:MAG: YkvA family protein [Anaerovoracaceae bacterium]
MKYIINFKLENGTYLNSVVYNARSSTIAVSEAIHYAGALGKGFEVNTSTPVRVESWGTKQAAPCTSGGNIVYKVYVCPLEGKSLCLSIKAQGVKTAYNTFMSNSGMEKNVRIVYFYNCHQKHIRKNSTWKAEKIIQDKEKTCMLFDDAMDMLESFPMLGPYMTEIPYMLHMVVDALKGEYKNLPMKSIVGITAGVLYFVSPIDLIPDIVPMAGQMDDVGVLIWVLNAVHRDIEKYKVWRKTKRALPVQNTAAVAQ